MTLADLLALRGADLATVCARTGVDPSSRDADVRYEALTDVERLDGPDAPRVFVRGDDVVLVYAGSWVLPQGLTSQEVAEAVGTDGEVLRSRQGKTALLHVAAQAGVAWSEDGGEVDSLELFPPTDLDTYRAQVYREPRAFTR